MRDRNASALQKAAAGKTKRLRSMSIGRNIAMSSLSFDSDDDDDDDIAPGLTFRRSGRFTRAAPSGF